MQGADGKPPFAHAARWALAITGAVGFMALALQLGRVDAGLGASHGPERLIQSIEPQPTATAAEAQIARRILHDRPVDGRAYRVLAAHAASQGQPDASQALYLTAVARWPRDRMARAVLAEQAFARGELDTSFEHLDALLRVAPGMRAPVLATLAPHLGNPAVRQQLIDRLQADPPWRHALPSMVLAETTPPEPAELLLSQLASTLPPSEAELNARVTLLQRLDRPAEARQVWLATLAAEDRAADGLVFDGGFERPDVSGGHGWHINVPVGASAGYDTSDAHAGSSSLAIEFGGRAVQFGGVRQALVLAPGRYRLQASAINQVDTSRPFALHLACAGKGRVEVTRLELPASAQWKESASDFEIPAGCASQTLELRHAARSMAERHLRGTLHVDAVTISKLRAGEV